MYPPSAIPFLMILLLRRVSQLPLVFAPALLCACYPALFDAPATTAGRFQWSSPLDFSFSFLWYTFLLKCNKIRSLRSAFFFFLFIPARAIIFYCRSAGTPPPLTFVFSRFAICPRDFLQFFTAVSPSFPTKDIHGHTRLKEQQRFSSCLLEDNSLVLVHSWRTLSSNWCVILLADHWKNWIT